MAKIISAAELAKHKQPNDYWLAIDGNVYDVSKYIMMHPGGEGVMRLCPRGVTLQFSRV